MADSTSSVLRTADALSTNPGVTALGAVQASGSESGFFQRDFFQLAFDHQGDLHLVFTEGQENPTSAAYTQADLTP